ncbi:AAA family ATPase [Priestia aryabhattai]|uniref:AAA family ATPase n=1 Tax=Priestia aryabhattai TaxID=412384 RepID=UPI00203F9104|nr:AAA family ATPase [Priestia aryabhattai]MCM3255578.1 AAA family ATPase [Priestia aryabhattai]
MKEQELFSLGRWDDKVHKEDFKKWITEISEFELLNSKFRKKFVPSSDVAFSNVIQISKKPEVEKDSDSPDRFKSKKGAGANFINIKGSWNSNDDQGAKYQGTSLIFFPCYEQLDSEDNNSKTALKLYSKKPIGILIAIGLGTAGAGQDAQLVGNPGHMRRFNGMIETIKPSIKEENIPLWWRKDPLSIRTIPQSFFKQVQDFFPNAHPFALEERQEASGGYGQYLYAVAALKLGEDGNLSQDGRSIVRHFLEFYFRERGYRGKDRKDDPANRWYEELFPPISEQQVKDILKTHRNVILLGPPGTKKTEILSKISKDYKGQSISYQFHPSVTYQTFVGGIQPLLTEGGKEKNDEKMGFHFAKGPLLEAIEKASSGKETLLALDEINRADLSSVLGEAIQLFEENKEYELQIKNYKNNPVKMSKTLNVLATMNSADRSISSMDVAIRRRFAFVEIWPQEPDLSEVTDQDEATVQEEAQKWFRKCRNIFLEYGEESDLLLMPGGFYFVASSLDQLKSKFKYRLIPLLQDYLLENRLSYNLKVELEFYLQELERNL